MLKKINRDKVTFQWEIPTLKFYFNKDGHQFQTDSN